MRRKRDWATVGLIVAAQVGLVLCYWMLWPSNQTNQLAKASDSDQHLLNNNHDKQQTQQTLNQPDWSPTEHQVKHTSVDVVPAQYVVKGPLLAVGASVDPTNDDQQKPDPPPVRVEPSNQPDIKLGGISDPAIPLPVAPVEQQGASATIPLPPVTQPPSSEVDNQNGQGTEKPAELKNSAPPPVPPVAGDVTNENKVHSAQDIQIPVPEIPQPSKAETETNSENKQDVQTKPDLPAPPPAIELVPPPKTPGNTGETLTLPAKTSGQEIQVLPVPPSETKTEPPVSSPPPSAPPATDLNLSTLKATQNDPPAPAVPTGPAQWKLDIKVVDGRTHLLARSVKGAEFFIRCDKLSLQRPQGTIDANGKVEIEGTDLQASCEHLLINWHEDRLQLEGSARLSSQRSGQQMELTGQQLNLRLSSVEETQNIDFR